MTENREPQLNIEDQPQPEPQKLEIEETEFNKGEMILISKGLRTKEQIIEARKKQEEEIIEHTQKTGLHPDSYNDWISLFYACDKNDFTNVTLPSYYEVYTRKARTPKLAKLILENSNPEKILKYNALVDALTDVFEEIKATQNFELLKQFHDRANKLIRNK